MVRPTFKQLEKRFNSVYMACDFDFYPSIWTCWHTELRVQVNQCQFCVLKPKKTCLSFLLGSLQLYFYLSTCLDHFMIFAPTHHECVIVFIKCSCPISLHFILSCLDILKWKAFLIKPTLCSISMIDVTINERN